MRIASSISRILLGLMFSASGAMGFLPLKFPAPPGLAGDFYHVYMSSHYVLFVDSVMLVAGALLLLNRFVPLALTLLAAVLFNILVFHLTMAPTGIVPGLMATVFWALAARPHRAHFASLLAARTASQAAVNR